MKFKNLAHLSTATLLGTFSLSDSAIGQTSDTATESCVNIPATQKCKPCEDTCPSGAITGGSRIDNAAMEYYNSVVDYSVSNTASGCQPCGGGVSLTGALPSATVTRLMRPRYAEFSNGDLQASFGQGHYWEEIDKVLSFRRSGNIGVFDPNNPNKNVFTSFVPARGGWADLGNSYFQTITAFDTNGEQITSGSNFQKARTAVLLHHDGSTDYYEIFWLRENGHSSQLTKTAWSRGFGRLVARLDPNGNAIQIDYANEIREDGFLDAPNETAANRSAIYRDIWKKSKVTDAYGRQITCSYTTSNGRNVINKLELPNGEEITYDYGNLSLFHGVLKKVNHPDGSTSTWTSKRVEGGLVKITQKDLSATGDGQKKHIYVTSNVAPTTTGGQRGQVRRLIRVVENGQDETKYANNIVRVGGSVDSVLIREGGNRIYKSTFGNDGPTNSAHVTDPALLEDFFNDELAATIATREIQTPGYDSNGFVSDSEDALSRSKNTTRSPLNNKGLLSSYPDGSAKTNTYNEFSKPLIQTDRLGRITASTYDVFGNMLTRTGAVGTDDETTSVYIYNTRGQIIEQRDALYDAEFPELHNTQYEYDSVGYLVKKIEAADEAGGTRPENVYTYDVAGRITSSSDPLGRTTTFEYDSRDRVIKTTYNDDSTELVEYGSGDLANLMISSTDRNGIRTEYEYDSASRKSKVTTAAGLPEQSVTEYTYLSGTTQLTSMNTNGEITEYDYDYANRRIATRVHTDAVNTLTTTTEYDQLGRRRSSTDAYGRSTYYLYDQNDRMIRTVRETVPGGIGNVPAFVDGSSQTSSAFTYTLTDSDGNRLQTSDTHKVSYTDPRDLFLNQLPRVHSFNARYLIDDCIYDAEGQKLITTNSRGIRTWAEYDELGRTTLTITAVGAGAEIRSEQDYDDNSNVIASRSPRHFTEGAGTTANLTGVGTDTYSYNGRNLRASHSTAVGSIEEQTQSWTYYLDGRSDEHIDFRGNIAKQIWHICCGRLQASIQRDGTSTAIRNTDFKGQVTHTATVSSLPVDGNYHNPIDADTLQEVTTRFDGRGRPTHSTVWLKPLGTVDDDARLSLGDATGIPIAGLDGIPATDGLTTTYEYDEDLTDGIGVDADYATELAELIARLGYNPFGATYNGYATTVTNPEGETSVQITDGAGRQIISINPEGDASFMRYDEIVSVNRLLPFGQTYSLLKTEAIDALGHSKISYTDGAGRTLVTENAVGARSYSGYNSGSSLSVTRDANELRSSCSYDALERQIACSDRQEQIEGNSRTRIYNAASQVVTSINADGETTTNVYDVRGRLESTTDGNNITTSYAYDANNNLITLTDGKGEDRQWFYDERNLATTKTYPSTTGNDFYTTTYDALRRPVVKTDQQGDTCTSIYDLASRMTVKEYRTGGITLESTDTYTYDAASRVLSTHKGRYDITTEHTYADDSMPLTETLIADGRTYTATRSYDAANRPESHTFPSGESTNWAYDARDVVTTVHYEDQLVTTNTHDAGYRLTGQSFGNGLTRNINYGRQDNLRTLDRVFKGNQAIGDLNLSYNYAADKQITAENIVGDVLTDTSFSANYDAGNRITSWSRPGNNPVTNNQTWNYDDAGNWNTENRSYNAADGITSIAGNTTTQDLKGNLTEFEINGKEYDVVNYDLDNRINKVDVDGTDVEYRYDAMGRRVLRKESNTTTALIWWGNSECSEHKHQAGETVIQNDIFDHPNRLNAVCARAVDGSKFKIQWYHKNYLDHVYAVSDDSGDILEHYRYTAFGEVTIYNSAGNIQQTSQIDNDILWNTRRLDPVSGFYLYKYRHYAPELGRWPSRDPIEEEGGINLYSILGNDAINDWDLWGLQEAANLPIHDGVAFTTFFYTKDFGRVRRFRKTLTFRWDETNQCCLRRTRRVVQSGSLTARYRLSYYNVPVDFWQSLQNNTKEKILEKLMGKLLDEAHPHAGKFKEAFDFLNDVLEDTEIPRPDDLSERSIVLENIKVGDENFTPIGTEKVVKDEVISLNYTKQKCDLYNAFFGNDIRDYMSDGEQGMNDVPGTQGGRIRF